MSYKEKWKLILEEKRFREKSATIESDGRNTFENDYGRLISSAPIRRLQDKTQVFPLEESDYIRTRLTHSLEVSYLASSIGQSIENLLLNKKELDISLKGNLSSLLRVAGLVHDLGNPPFGHFGEEAIKKFFKQYFKTRLNQQFFINGADTMFSGASKRYSNGYNYAKNRLTNTQSNLWEELMTDKDKDNHFTRPVIVISHSMGGAFAEGMLSFFKKMKLNVEKVIHFSPADVSGFTVNFPEITYQIDINPDPVLKFKNLNDRPLIRNIKNASVAQNPLDDMYGHDYSKRKGFVWNWFEDLNELKFKPIRKVNLPSWGGLKEHQVYELIYTHGSKFDLLMKNGVVYMSLEFNLGLKTTKNEYIKAF